MLDIILVNVFLVFHSSCVNFINSYINHKPPGIQTLYDLVLANTLTLQVGLLWFIVLILDLAEILGPVHPWVAWTFCFMIDVVFFIHNFFMILTTSVRYFSIYHSTLLLTFEDQQFLKVAWRIILVTSFILTISDNDLTPFENMTLYNLLMENFEVGQVGSKLNAFLFVTMTFLILALQYKIEMDDQDNSDRNNDRWTCFGVVVLFLILSLALFGVNPTVKVFTWRMVLQIAWINGFLIRFMMQNQNLLEHVKLKFRHQPLIVVHC